MYDLPPEEHDRGRLSREAPCPTCSHDHGHFSKCDACFCAGAMRNGIDF